MKKRTLFLFQFFIVGALMASDNSTNSTKTTNTTNTITTTNNFGPCYFDSSIANKYKTIPAPGRCEISNAVKKSLGK